MKNLFELTAPCHFGLEAVLKREIIDLGYDVTRTENGKVSFEGDAEAIARANVWLRTAERVMITVGEFKAESFEELFQGTMAIPWENFIPKDARFWVTKATSVNSKLFSPSDIQSIMKKAMVRRLGAHYGIERFEETGAAYPLRVFIHNDIVSVALDTSGASLHKRGYRTETAKAPITETLAAALLMLTPWHKDRILVDPFCGSGTFPIEAAMMAANMAPGMNREFLSQEWTNLIPKKCWYDTLDEANDLLDLSVETDIQGYDIDPKVLRAARINAEQAGVKDLIHLQERDVGFLAHPKKYGFIITNPPYGERLKGEEEEIAALYRVLGERFRELDDWSLYMITSFPAAEKCIGRKADKNRKIYNGMMKTYFYQFEGKKPPKRRTEGGGRSPEKDTAVERKVEKFAKLASEEVKKAAKKVERVNTEVRNTIQKERIVRISERELERRNETEQKTQADPVQAKPAQARPVQVKPAQARDPQDIIKSREKRYRLEQEKKNWGRKKK